VDPADDEVGLLDALYYSTVSVTTTGYGDVRPESDSARLFTTVLVTPARVLFLILLVGTTLEVLAERTRATYRLARWRRTLTDHVIFCGFGTKGRAAANTLPAHGFRPDRIVIVDEREEPRSQATAMGWRRSRGAPPRRERCARLASKPLRRWWWRSAAMTPPCWRRSLRASSTRARRSSPR
jgi:voltage-gated potassium channel